TGGWDALGRESSCRELKPGTVRKVGYERLPGKPEAGAPAREPEPGWEVHSPAPMHTKRGAGRMRRSGLPRRGGSTILRALSDAARQKSCRVAPYVTRYSDAGVHCGKIH